jgi:hypothetical protein
MLGGYDHRVIPERNSETLYLIARPALRSYLEASNFSAYISDVKVGRMPEILQVAILHVCVDNYKKCRRINSETTGFVRRAAGKRQHCTLRCTDV